MTNLPSMNHPATSTVEFRGAQLITIKQDDIEYVAMRPIIEAIGLNWATQQDKFQRNKAKFSCTLIGTTGKDGKNYNMLCIPITKFNGWAFSINTERIPDPEVRKRVELYQEECFLALYNYWHTGKTERPANEMLTLTAKEQHEISQAVKLRAGDNHKAIPEIWGRIKNKFKVAKYSQLRSDRFNDVMDYIASMEIHAALPKSEADSLHESGTKLPDDEKQILIDDVVYQADCLLDEAERLATAFRNVNLIVNKIMNTMAVTNPEQYRNVRLKSSLKRCSETAR